VADVHVDLPGKAAEQLVLPGVLLHCHFYRAELTPLRVVSHHSAQRVRQELVTVADAEDGNPRVHVLPEPACRPLAPVPALRDHGVRPGDDDPRVPVCGGQRITGRGIDHHDFRRGEAQAGDDPVLEIAFS
jgi:hypothetical protein